MFWLSWAAFRVLTATAGLGGGKRSSPLHHICEKYFPLQPLLYWICSRRLNTDHLYCSSFILPYGAARADPAILSCWLRLAALLRPFPPVRARQVCFLGRRVCSCTLCSWAYVCPLLWRSHLHIFVLWDSSKALIPIPEPSQVPLALISVTAPEDTRTDYDSFPCLQLLSVSLTHTESTQVFFEWIHEWTGFWCVSLLVVFPLQNRDALKLLFDCREWGREWETFLFPNTYPFGIQSSLGISVGCGLKVTHTFPLLRTSLHWRTFTLPFKNCSVQVRWFTGRQHNKGSPGVTGGDGNLRTCCSSLVGVLPFLHGSCSQLNV